jgi:hypothetical protein
MSKEDERRWRTRPERRAYLPLEVMITRTTFADGGIAKSRKRTA